SLVGEPSCRFTTSTDYKRFRHEATNAVVCKPKSRNTDERRIRYIGALFTGVALDWYMLWQAQRTTLLQEVNPSPKELERRAKEYDMLIQDMDTQFKDPLEIQTYRSLLNKVNQGNMPFNEYATYLLNAVLLAELNPSRTRIW
ncbi:hypothetical protein SeLEV6574_g08571, partial [Synchytrium endobioticum]